jgi:hypothetical protein
MESMNRPISTPLPRAAAALRLATCAVLLASHAGEAIADDLIVVDVDAHAVSSDQAGALFAFDPAAPIDSAPIVLAAADGGAPFEFLGGLAISPLDGSAFAADWGSLSPPVVHRVDCATGAVTQAAADPRFVEPLGATFLPDGRLVIADWDADPSGLGPDSVGGLGHGAIFVVDVRSCIAGCAVTVLSDGRSHPFGPSIESAFEDPIAVQHDAIGNRLLVADLAAPPSLGWTTSVYAVDLVTGAVSVVSNDTSFLGLRALGIETSGTILAVDGGNFAGDGSVWRIDPFLPTDRNATLLSGGAQYSFVEDVDVDSAGRIFLIDSGDWNGSSFDTPPGLFEIDTTNRNPSTNGVLVNQSIELVNPFAIAARQGACIPAGRLAVNRSALRNSASVRLQFVDGTCLRPPWSFCVDQVLDAALDGLVMAGEAAPARPESLRLYEHSDPVTTMKLRRVGSDLVFSSN